MIDTAYCPIVTLASEHCDVLMMCTLKGFGIGYQKMIGYIAFAVRKRSLIRARWWHNSQQLSHNIIIIIFSTTVVVSIVLVLINIIIHTTTTHYQQQKNSQMALSHNWSHYIKAFSFFYLHFRVWWWVEWWSHWCGQLLCCSCLQFLTWCCSATVELCSGPTVPQLGEEYVRLIMDLCIIIMEQRHGSGNGQDSYVAH